MSIRRLRKRLEAARQRACGPDCPPEAVVRYYQDGPDGELVLDEGQEPPAPCARCGRPARVVERVVVYDEDFYGNAARLPEMKA